jgi:hypothetical protein
MARAIGSNNNNDNKNNNSLISKYLANSTMVVDHEMGGISLSKVWMTVI